MDLQPRGDDKFAVNTVGTAGNDASAVIFKTTGTSRKFGGKHGFMGAGAGLVPGSNGIVDRFINDAVRHSGAVIIGVGKASNVKINLLILLHVDGDLTVGSPSSIKHLVPGAVGGINLFPIQINGERASVAHNVLIGSAADQRFDTNRSAGGAGKNLHQIVLDGRT